MTFLPIADRELRVASRKRSTFWLRVVAAAVTILISGSFLGIGGLMQMQTGSMFPLSLGAILFQTLSWMTFGCVCLAGVFFSSDTLSEEKREGTLGLLFLTDLRGYDVVLGKLMAIALRSFYGLLAVFPIVGITLTMGGVTGAEFWQRMLALVNTLFFSLAAGIFVSSMSRESQKALGATLSLILLIVVGLPFADLWIAHLRQKPLAAILSYASPWYACNLAGNAPAKEFVTAIGVVHLLAWIFLGLASIFTPRVFHEKTAGATSKKNWIYLLQFGSENGRTRRRLRFLAINPALWLAHRHRWRWLFLWIFSFASVGLFAWIIAENWSKSRGMNYGILMTANFFFGVVILAMKFWMASQASRFFVEAWRTGALELLLASPLPEKKIVGGQWNALIRLFLVPTLLIVLTQAAFGFLQIQESATTGYKGPFNSSWQAQLVTTFLHIAVTICDLAALAWFGMWMGMTTRRPNVAVLKTLLFVIAIPWIVSLFTQGYLMFLVAWAHWPFWVASIVVSGLLVAKDILFIIWSARNLNSKFRTVAAGTVRPVFAARQSPPFQQRELPPVIPSPQT
jgi:ABC-type transport system involved in multi-copper enzyme maturation permease subunit